MQLAFSKRDNLPQYCRWTISKASLRSCVQSSPSDQIVDVLSKTVATILNVPRNKDRLARVGGTPMPMSPSEFGEFIVAQTAKWAKVIKFAGAKID